MKNKKHRKHTSLSKTAFGKAIDVELTNPMIQLMKNSIKNNEFHLFIRELTKTFKQLNKQMKVMIDE